jgi:hypothetical protein
MLAALRADQPDDDRGTELLSQINHLDLIPVVLVLAELAARSAERQHGSREAATTALEEQLLHLASRSS